MALASTDPRVLMRSAGCFGCLSPHQHLQVQTYLLAVIAGLSTSATGVQTLSVASTCFSCLTKVELIRLKQYLMATWLGLDTSQAGIQALVKAASCVPCLTPRQQQLVQTYLLTVSAGQPTSSAGVQAIEAGSKCFSCLLTKQQYEVQVYILAGLSGATFAIPADLVAGAKCFESCLPFELEEILQTSLIAQAASRLTPPCITPTAPVSSAGAKSIGNTSFRIVWSQPANTGSLITSYTIKWGTVSGVYPNSVTIPVIPRVYDLTGLTPGTQYFWVVVANSFAGCFSANSNEGSATTTGNAPGNGLLVGLVSYWSYDVNLSDSKDANTWTKAGAGGGAGTAGGIINNYFSANNQNAWATLNPAPANLRLGNGVSFSVSIWVLAGGYVGGVLHPIMTQYDNTVPGSSFACFVNGTTGNITLNGYQTNGNQTSLVDGASVGGAVWEHVVFGYDATNKQLFLFHNNGAKQTQATTADLNSVATAIDICAATVGLGVLPFGVDETAFWVGRVLTASDVNLLYNGGAGLPFSSFTP